MDFKEIIRTIAPTVASALGGPLAGVAVTAIGGILGIDQPTQDKISDAITSGQMKPEQVAQIKALEMEYQDNERERQFKYTDLEFKDRDSARQREAAVGDKTNRNLAYAVILAFIAVVILTLFGKMTVDSVLAGTLIGYLSAKAEQVLAYYFGSTRNSERKTELLAQSTPASKSA